jgi:hypothetical protein
VNFDVTDADVKWIMDAVNGKGMTSLQKGRNLLVCVLLIRNKVVDQGKDIMDLKMFSVYIIAYCI